MKVSFRTGVLLCLLSTIGWRARAQEQPAGPQPPAGPQGPTPGITVQQPPPPPPKVPEVLRQDEGNPSITFSAFLPHGQPTFDFGSGITPTYSSLIQFQGKDKLAPSIEVSIPAIRHNALTISYFDTSAAGNFTANTTLYPWTTYFSQGDYMTTDYRLRDVKVSFDFLTWPYPPGQRRFRFKTLWQVQYVNVNTTFSAPLSTVDTNVASGSKNIILPTLGIGVSYYLTNHFRVEANGSGFGIPGHSVLGDLEANAAYKLGHIELRGGGRWFHFKTSSAADYYTRGTLAGAFVGLRFYWR